MEKKELEYAMDHNEYCCIFDTSQYTGTPDTTPCPNALNVPLLIQELDRLCGEGHEAEARDLLEKSLEAARKDGDWRSELTVLSELLGQYRRTGEADKGLRTVNEALELVRVHRLGRTVSGATVLLNAATTLKAFGHAAESIPVFTHAAHVYADSLDPSDYRFAGLYNNMALSYDETGDADNAERCFRLALSILEKIGGQENDCAVTWCNMAEMYGRRDLEDERIAECLENAWDCLSTPNLPHDGYHAFTISKCAPTFDYFGFFLYAKELRERAKKIYAGA